MRILIVTHCASELTGGGMARLVHDLAGALAASNTVMLLRPSDTERLELPQPGQPGLYQLAARGEGELRLPDLRPAAWRRLQDVLAAFRPEVIHAQDYGPLAMLMQDFANAHRLPFVLTLHLLPSQSTTFGSAEVPEWLQRIADSRPFHRFVRSYMERSTAMTALNEAQTADLRAFGYRGPLHHIPNGRDLASLGSLPLAPQGAAPRLIFVGSFAKRKNQLVLLEMLAHLSADCELELLGETLEPTYLAHLHDTAARLGLQERVRMQHVPYSDIGTHLSRAHVFVSASTLEVQSLAVIEALAAGTPVVGLANETIDELVDASVGVRLEADATPEELAEAVERVLALHRADYEAICTTARARVAHCAWPQVTARLEALYRSPAAKPPPQHRHPAWTPFVRAAACAAYIWPKG
ncbi:MAG: glycosyltransferase family 4 protein [Chloroflexi bacterium]|nr:glycosyltransferase family 4 protein [Chloroflexota bacterium]